jgi:hypothetical protein
LGAQNFKARGNQEAMVPVEVNLQTLRVVAQDNLSVEDYGNLMMDRVDEASESRLQALRGIEKDKLQVSKAYNEKVQEKSFQIGDLVWKMILPIGSRSGCLAGMGHIGSLGLYQEIHTL